MQITFNTSVDAFLAPRAAAQAPRGNGDNESFARLMQQRRDEASSESTQTQVTRQAADDSADSTYDMTPKPSASTSDAKAAGENRDTSATDDATSRSHDGNTVRIASESKSLVARKAESAKLEKRASGTDMSKTDSAATADPADKPADAASATGNTPAEWIAAMGGLRPKQQPVIEPAPDDANAESTTTAASGPAAGTPLGATIDPVTTPGNDRQTGVRIIATDQPPVKAVRARPSPDDQPISVAPTTDAAQKIDKADPVLQATDPTSLAMLQSNALAASGVRKDDKSSAAEPVTTVDATVGAAAAVAAAGSAPSQAADVPVVQIATPVHAPEFKEALGVQISMMAKDGVQHAELHLNPSDMGPISVQIATEGTHARVDFGADSAATRHILEAGLPELASALRDAGMTLTGGGVSQHAQGGSQGDSDSRDGSRGSRRASIGFEGASTLGAATVARTQRGALDLYA